MKIKNILYRALRLSRDTESIKKGTYHKRVAKREVRKAMRKNMRRWK